MSELIVRGGKAADGSPLDIAIEGGRIAAAPTNADADVVDATGLTVLPGFLDLQVNGVAGIDLTLEPERLWEAAAALPAYGVTAFVPTVITSAADARERALATLAGGPPEGWSGAEPLGLHFEGPMIATARKGAHPEQWLRPPSPELVDGWSREDGVAMVTVAPELPGALDVISTLADRGIVVSLGHSEATADQAADAVARGARLVTHLGNAMPGLQARAPGLVGAALTDSRLTAGVIADGHHLDPVTLRLFWQALGPERLLAVTDCTAALGLPDGPVRLGDQHVVLRDGTVRLADGTLAGSAVSLPDCLRQLRDVLGLTLAEAAATCTSTAARLLGESDRGVIATGARGDLTLVDDALDVVATVVGGHVVHGGH